MDESYPPVCEDIPNDNIPEDKKDGGGLIEANEDFEQMEQNTDRDEDQIPEAKPYNPFIKAKQENEGEESSVVTNNGEELMELQCQYDELMALYQESVERSNTLQSSLLLKEMRMHSIEIQIKSVIDELMDQKANGHNELDHSIKSLQSVISSFSQDSFLESDSEDSASVIEDTPPLHEISASVDTLEQYVKENDSLITTLKEFPTSYEREINDLKARLSVLYTTNILLNDVIDSNNQHVGELSHVINEKTQELQKLREAEIEYKEETQSGVEEMWKQMQELQALLNEEQAYRQQLEMILDQQMDLQPVHQPDHQPDHQVEQQVDQQVEQQVDQQPVQQVEQQPNEQPLVQVDQQLDQQMDQQSVIQSDLQVDQQPDQQMDQQPDLQPDLQMDQQLDQQMDQQPNEQPDQQVDQQSLQQPGIHPDHHPNDVQALDRLQKRLEEAESTIQYLRNELHKQSDEQLFETTVGQFSTLNPTAIIACIEGLVSRVSLAEAKAVSTERRMRGLHEESEEKETVSNLEGMEKLNCQYQQIITKLQKRLAKYKKNEKTYRQLLFGMKETIKNKEKQLFSVYSIINGISKYVVKEYNCFF